MGWGAAPSPGVHSHPEAATRSLPLRTFQIHRMAAQVRDYGTGGETEAQSGRRTSFRSQSRSVTARPVPLVRGHVSKGHCLKGLTETAPDLPQALRGILGTFVHHRPANVDDGQTRGAAGPPEGPSRLEARGPQGLCGIPWTAAWMEDCAGNW